MNISEQTKEGVSPETKPNVAQASHLADTTRSKKPDTVVTLRQSLSRERALAIGEELNCRFLTPSNFTKHPHPFLATCRVLCERMMHKIIAASNVKRVIDVGSNPARTDDYKILPLTTILHVSTPSVLPNDKARARGALTRHRENHCFHTIQEECCGPFDVAISTHVLYYVAPQELADFLERQVTSLEIYSVHHIFLENQGKITGGGVTEATWRLEPTNPPTVHMSVLPDTQKDSYTHPLQLYLQRERTPVKQGTLVTQTVHRAGDTYLTRTTLVVGLTSPPHEVMVTIPRRQEIGPFSVIHDSVIPKHYLESSLGYVAVKMVNRLRDTSALEDAVFHAKRAVKDAKVPLELQPEAIVQLAYHAQTRTLALETDMANQITSDFGKAIERHAIALTRPNPWSTWWYILYSAVIGLGVKLRAKKLLAITVSYPTAKLAIHLLTSPYLINSVRQWIGYARRGEPITTYIPIRETVTLPPTAVLDTDYPLQDPTAKLQVDDDPNPVRHPAAPASSLKSVGVSTTILPSVHQKGPETEIAALKHRVFLQVPTPDPEYSRQMQTIFWGSPAFTHLLNKYVPPPLPRLRSLWLSHLPGWDKVMMKKAWQSLKSDPLGTDPNDYIRTLFPKIEKSEATSDQAGTPKTKPRAIQGCNVNGRYKAYCGPGLWHLQNWLFTESRSSGQYIIAPGLTCEQLGHAFGEHYREPSQLLRTDFSKFDCHFRRMMFEFCFRCLVAIGLDPSIAEHELAAGLHGRSRHGIEYEAELQIASGDPSTSLLGSFGNLFVISSFCYSRRIPFFSLISGDDGLTVIPPDVPMQMVDDFVNHCRLLGFTVKPKLTLHVYRGLFCSKLFWPTPEGFILGALPGRQLGKMGWFLNTTDSGNFRGVLIAAQRDSNHVPFLRCYVKRCLELTKGQLVKYAKHHMHINQCAKPHVICPLTWTYVKERYGLTEQDEQLFGQWLDSIVSLPWIQTHPIMDRLIRVDSEQEE